jgi:hypothetical protein
MWDAFKLAFIAIFGGVGAAGSAFGKTMGALDNLAGVAEATTKQFAEEADFKRDQQRARLEAEMKAYRIQLEANPVQVPAITQ